MTATPDESWSDERLLARLRAGEHACAVLLASRYRPALQRYCRNYLTDDARAEDVVQETLTQLSVATDQPAGPVKAWLYRVARNRCLDILRRYRRSPTHNRPLRTGVDLARNTAGPGTKAAREERRTLIREIVLAMPEEYRSVLMLKFFEGLSRAEIAAALDVTEATVKGRLVRATDYLHEQLRDISGIQE